MKILSFLSSAIKAVFRYIHRERLSFGLVLIAAILMFIWNFRLESALSLTIFLAFLLHNWDGRIIAIAAIVMITLCPFLLMLRRDAFAEQMAILAYYFLAMAVVLQIIEYRREAKINDIHKVNVTFKVNIREGA